MGASGMISLRSKVTKELLSFFFLNPHEELFVNELAGKLTLDKRNLVKKLRELEKEGVLNCERKGNLKLYSINMKYPLYKEYRSLVLKTMGIEEKIRQIVRKAEGIKKAYIYGSYAKDKLSAHSDIDILIVGSHDIINLQKQISALQRKCGREIIVVNMGLREYNLRQKKKDPFISEIMKEKHIEISK
jgi:predicted nucleotidyltransferase